jgi:hypothetical protein
MIAAANTEIATMEAEIRAATQRHNSAKEALWDVLPHAKLHSIEFEGPRKMMAESAATIKQTRRLIANKQRKIRDWEAAS